MVDERNEFTILVVDDEPALAELLQTVLSGSGYRAYSFTDAMDALVWYKNHSNSVALVFIDLKMPIIDGKTLFTKIVAINPQQSIAIMSGFSEEKTVHDLMKKGALNFFEKPFDIRGLIAWVDQTIQSGTKISTSVA